MTAGSPTPGGSAPASGKPDKKQRLAEALRRNLRRRRQAAPPAPPPKESGGNG